MVLGHEPLHYRSVGGNVASALLLPFVLAIMCGVGALPGCFAILAFATWTTPRATRSPEWMGEVVGLVVVAFLGAAMLFVIRSLRAATIASEQGLVARDAFQTVRVPRSRISAVRRIEGDHAENLVMLELADGEERAIAWPSARLDELKKWARSAPRSDAEMVGYPEGSDGFWQAARVCFALAVGVSMATLLFAVDGYGTHRADVARTSRVVADVVGVEVHDSPDGPPETEVQVVFPGAGLRVVRTVWRPGAGDIEVEDRVAIRFDPYDPTNAEFADIPPVFGSGIRVLWTIAVVVAVVGAVGLIGSSFHLERRSRRARRSELARP